ncbi:hypothetical protein [Clostridium perfringens]|uniref:hypothetical protein n=1 Tax=Clostridium perfringens TaxID=1502 RepID=UPI000166673B|nr:hypothetical protein [Clostridium perfringens]EDS79603.1 conserved hypothetical protein [Clostridium perfringens C str. JGS1495]MBI6030241.1 hypothetical protein [Clostridium perfringens]MBI6033492.1 hypothetical protein [Clostridium perfringens]MBI6068050.1 hypothetical protein [Clostridium perfringens]MBI6096808.1 hypothetical protein [Clostridium perfringens]
MSEIWRAEASFQVNYGDVVKAFDIINKKGNEAEKTLGKVGKKTETFGDKLLKLNKKVGKIATKGSAMVTTPILAIGTAAFKAASDINESLSKSEVVFGNNAKAVEEWSKTATTSFGASQNEALEMVSKFGAMGKAMGLNSEQTKDYSMNLTQLAGDLASFNNISVDMANTALTGVFTGETESLKGLGIVMTQVNLQRFAESQGIHKKIQDMTQAEQVQLRYNYVMSQTKDAQGDYMRTSDSAANSAKTFRKSLANLSASFGQFLLALTPLIQVATSLIVKFNNLDDGTKKIIIVIAGLIAGIFPLLLAFSKTITAIHNIKTGFVALNKGIKGGIVGLKNFTKATKNGTNAIGKFGKGIVSVTKAIVRFMINLAKSTLQLIKNGALWVANKVKMLAYKTAQIAVTGATKAMTLAQKALNLAMKMNPIGLVITLLLGLAVVFVTLYNKCEWFRNGVNKVWSFITSIFTKFSNFLTGIFTTDWTKSFGVFGNIINGFVKNIENRFNAIKRIFSGVIEFVKGVFTGDWSRAWQGVVDIFGGIMNGLGAVIKAPLNTVISLVNMAIDGLNKISFTAPDWIPGVGGKHFGVNIPKMNYLYTGAVFDEPTLLGNNTVVGDKFKGQGKQREYVLPEPLIRQVVKEEVTSVISKLGIFLDGKEVGHCLGRHKDEIDKGYQENNPFVMA